MTTTEGINDKNQHLVNRISADGISPEHLLQKLQMYSASN
jgi:hypothetical protein